MKRTRALALILSLVFSAPQAAWSAAVPEFESSYKVPTPTEPSPRGELPAYADLAVLAGALGIAAWLAHKRRSRKYMLALTVASLFYFGLYRHGCVCSVGSVQNMALACFDSGYAVPLTVAGFFFLPLLFTLFLGRVFCSGVCPLGAIQDVFLLRPVKVPSWLEQALGLLAWIYLGAAVLFAATASAFIICEYDPFISFFRRSGSLSMLLFGSSFLLLSVFVGRPYCRFLCPYGALMGFFSRFSWRRVTVTPDHCLQCRLCEDSCPFGAIVEPDPVSVRESRTSGRRIAALFALLAVLIVLGGWGGKLLGPSFSTMHSTVRLAQRIFLEESGVVSDTTNASDAFRKLGQTPAELYAAAAGIRLQFSTWGTRLGILVGAVVGLKLIALSIRRKRTDWEASRANCLACARCFEYCPQEHVRLHSLSLPSSFGKMMDPLHAPATSPSPSNQTRVASAGAACCPGGNCQSAVGAELINWAPVAKTTAFVAGAFALTVVVMVTLNYVRSAGAGPLNNADMSQLKQALYAAPQDEAIKQHIRDLDRQLRSEFFQRQRFAETGRSMILLGIAAFLIAVKVAASFNKRLPRPLPAGDVSVRRERRAAFSRYAVATLAMSVGVAGAVLALSLANTAGPPAVQDSHASQSASVSSPQNSEAHP